MEHGARLEEISRQIKVELSTRLSSAEYMLWVDPLLPHSFDNGQLVFVTPSVNSSTTLLGNYSEIFLQVCQSLEIPVMDIFFIAKSEIEKMEGKPFIVKKEEPVEVIRHNPFVAKYTFDNFVVAATNNMAFYAAHTVAENPCSFDDSFPINPLYIHGGVGLGKTHLLHAIGNYIFANNPNLEVVYTTAEKISNEYFESLSKYSSDKNSYRNFRQKYVKCDVLMIDDVQFMQRKGGLQEVFFHIFNDLYMEGKQIVLASDRPPKEINDIEDRLRSRFESGLIADIDAPSLDTRINIIKKKLESLRLTLSEDIIFYLAETVNTNVRELEGSLSKIIMFSKLNHKLPTLESAKEVLKERYDASTDALDSDKIINFVSEYFRIPASEIIGKKKNKDIVEARMVAIYLVCTMLNLPLVNIGQIFGGRDHATIIYSRDKISAQIGSNNSVDRTIKDIKASFNCK